MVILAAIGGALVLVVVLLAARAQRRRATARRVNGLFDAAVAGDRDGMQRSIGRGSVDLRDRQGNSALHLAYYQGEHEAIEALIAFGADQNLRNGEGLSPAQLGEVADIELLLTKAAQYLDARGTWLDRDAGRASYDQLKRRRPHVYNPALVRRAVRNQDGPQLLHLAIKVGVHGSEQKLAEVLHGYGTVAMAEDYLNAGSPTLHQAAETWARSRGYTIHYTGGQRSITWGKF